MTKPQAAMAVFSDGANCAQSVLFTYGKAFFKDEPMALKLASGFGGGISSRGELCGAVSASLMVLGLHFGYDNIAKTGSKEKTLKITKEFLAEFEKQNNSLYCSKLLDVDMSTDEGRQQAREKGLFKDVCPKLIESAGELLDIIIEKYSGQFAL